jgi:RHS repeat-associated protein
MANTVSARDKSVEAAAGSTPAAPTISLPKGGGAIRGIGEKFSANPVTGTGSLAVPIAVSPGRSGFRPHVTLSYDSGAGNGPFGLGWSLGLPSITRKTDKGLPRYDESDVFLLSGAEDLVRVLVKQGDAWLPENLPRRTVNGVRYRIQRYRPRVEGLFARIERWTNDIDPTDVFWRSISRDNVTTWYGKTSDSRIADPSDPVRIFGWLICQSHDDKGNVIVYGYKRENADNVDMAQANERNRERAANRYVKWIRYGNHVPYLPVLAAGAAWPEPPAEGNWYFQLVFDYGEHDPANPRPNDPGTWAARADPFSSYRSGFEVRTYRLCRRVLMFHHFADEPDVGTNCLVRSTDLTYSSARDPADARSPVLSTLLSVAHVGYKRKDASSYLARSLPPVEFTYSEALIQSVPRELDVESVENLPAGIDEASYRWVDLDGDGLPGILTEQSGGWLYKRNLSPLTALGHDDAVSIEARFAPVEVVDTTPVSGMGAGRAQFLDLAGDGRPDLVRFEEPMPGFHERTVDERWEPFVAFGSLPTLDWNDPNLRFVDVDGDGHADILVTEEGAFTWYPSLAAAGFAAARRVDQPWDEERGARVVFADGTQSIHLADLSGDGLTDIVRIRNGEVCYWPNLGYGRFGVKVTMDDAPVFDAPDRFDPRRIRLADIDGSGTTDILYLRPDGVHVYFNRSGNGWSSASTIAALPGVDEVTRVEALDLLGTGTACLVWSSPLPGDARRPLRYVDLMGGQKPHLLMKVKNNLGAETDVQYAPSTRFYLRDKVDGQPWITKLPFPVHCVEKVTVTDKWRQTSFSSTYSYHHGYFDGPEREFRGFGRVEQIDVESYGEFARGNAASPYITADKTLYQPPVNTVTWYHTGAFLDRERILSHFAHEYFPRWLEGQRPHAVDVLAGFAEQALPEPDLAAMDLDADEWREALRACKGMVLRQEVYELNVAALELGEHRPTKLFSVSDHNCHIERLQAKADNPHAVFLVAESEVVTYHHELDLTPATLTPDPRIAHTLNLRFDEYGHVLQSVAAVYPRLGQFLDASLSAETVALVRRVQAETHLAYTETRYTDDVVRPDGDTYRLRVPCEVLTYELTGIGPGDADHGYFTLDRLHGFRLSPVYQASGDAVSDIPYHALASGNTPEKRLVEHTRTLFFDDTAPVPAVPLPFRRLGRLGLTFETYTLALTTPLLDAIFGGDAGNKLDDSVRGATTARELLGEATTSGYLTGADLTARFAAVPAAELSGQYCIRSGIAGFAADAAQHFYLPQRYTDPFGNVTNITYARDLFVASTTDAMANTTRVTRFDFRVLAPREVEDVNGNLTEVLFDILGLPVAMALKGKGTEGDDLTDFDETVVNPSPPAMAAFFDAAAYDEAQARAWLGRASTRHVYYSGETRQADGAVTWAAHPACACGIRRERHLRQLAPGEQTTLQTAFEYSDGLGAVVVKKVQAEPEAAGAPLRWVASGKTILNNKGKAVKQYEPYFSAPAVGHRFEEPQEEGVTAVVYYDAVGRPVRTDHPDGSYGRVAFSPWHVTTYDANDTIAEPGNAWFARKSAPTASAEDRRAARLSADHANTPALTILDSLGREVVTVAHNRVRDDTGALVDAKYVTFTKLDAEGKPLWIRDARNNLAMQYVAPWAPPNQPTDPVAGFVPCYDIAGNHLFQHSMDAGDRWTLNDSAGKPMLAWNGRGHTLRTEYDALHRPTGSFVIGADPADAMRVIQFEKSVYGDTLDNGLTDAQKTQLNLRGKLYRHLDTAGIAVSMASNPVTGTDEAFDFKGNPLRSTHQSASDYKNTPDWSQGVALDTEIFTRSTRYDALNRPIQIVVPHGDRPGATVSVTRPGYNEAGLLERLDVWLEQAGEPSALLDPETATRHMVTNIDYNAKGQRLLTEYAEGPGHVVTKYSYDPETFRLLQLQTERPNRPDADRRTLQALSYAYDPVGNVTTVQDDAQDRVFHSNACVEAGTEYIYDALYRLTAASGREHRGDDQQTDWDDGIRTVTTLPNDCHALQNYVETYRYDAVGNLLQMRHHQGNDLDHPGLVTWNRRYQYALDSNRLLATRLPADPDNLPEYTAAPGYTARYVHDAHGNMTQMPHLATLKWDFEDQLRMTQRQVVNDGPGERTYYVYDASGERARKVTERQNGQRKDERLYFGGLEMYRAYAGDGATVKLERETLHVMDDHRRVALIETRTRSDGADPAPRQLVRYEHANHLGSSTVEVDDTADVISYEEYYPYGGTAYQAKRNAPDTPKRYRYTAKERDEETGLYYHGARYYVAWLGRWLSCDPAGIDAGVNLFEACKSSPINITDRSGAWPELLDKKLPAAGQVVSGAMQSEKTFAKEIFAAGPAGQIVHGAQTLYGIATAKDPVAAAVAAAKGQITTVVPPAAMGIALLEGRGLAAGVEETTKKVPFADVATDVDRTVKAARKGDVAGTVQHGTAAARHFGTQVGNIVAAAAGGGKSSARGPATEPPVAAVEDAALAKGAEVQQPAQPPTPVEPPPPTPTSAPPEPPPAAAPAATPTAAAEAPQGSTSPSQATPAPASQVPDVYVGALRRWRITPTAGNRGVDPTTRQEVVDWAQRYGTMDGPPTTGPVHAGHQYGGSHVFTPNGQPTQVGAQTALGNLRQSSAEARAAAARRQYNQASPTGPQLFARPRGSK